MPDKVINRASGLMREQTAAYRRLAAVCEQLIAALVRGEAEPIESLTRAGQAELLGLRSRLAQITSALSSFAAMRNAAPDRTPISAETREQFEAASNDLISTVRDFERVRARASALAINGAAFAGACIEMCGVQPTTYNAPYARRGDGRPWA
jgi:hypothetical protein